VRTGIRRLLPLLVLPLLLASTGCMRHITRVIVKPDGSGQIIVTQTMSGQMVEMMEGMAGMAGPDAKAEDPFFKPEELKAAAAKYGEGVEFTRAEPVKRPGVRGSVAVYTFADINKVVISPDMSTKALENMQGDGAGEAEGGEDGEAEKPKEPFKFAFAQAGGVRTLRVILPPMPDKPAAQDEAAGGEAGSPDDLMADVPAGGEGGPSMDLGAAMMGGMSGMFKGMQIMVTVEVEGEPTSSTASVPFPESKNRFILMNADFDKIIAANKFDAFMKDGQNDEMDRETAKKLVDEIDGFQMELKPEIVITF